MKSLRNSALGLTLGVATASAAFADGHAKELTIAIVNNGHMINMQKVAEAYTEETGVALNWVCLLYTSPSPRDLSTSRMPSSA